MPELPEVEITRRALAEELTGTRIEAVLIRTPKLRLPVPPELSYLLPGRTLREVGRRGKYLLLSCDDGWLVIHLGMGVTGIWWGIGIITWSAALISLCYVRSVLRLLPDAGRL